MGQPCGAATMAKVLAKEQKGEGRHEEGSKSCKSGASSSVGASSNISNGASTWLQPVRQCACRRGAAVRPRRSHDGARHFCA